MALNVALCLLSFGEISHALPLKRTLPYSNLNYDDDSVYANWPTYDQLPLHPSCPSRAAWGVGSQGTNDHLGALNHITPRIVHDAAANEIQTGETVNLNLLLDIPDPPTNPSRKPLVHLFQPAEGYTDDVLTMNTQISTQYDGLRHFPYSTDNDVDSYQWYNDLIPDYEDVIGPVPTTHLGIQEAAQKGIAGRGVLLDYAGYADVHNASIDAFTDQAITASDLQNVADWQGFDADTDFKAGDILLVRTGWVRAYQKLSLQEQAVLPARPNGGGSHIGIHAGDVEREWFWNKKLALVGADNPAFERIPLRGMFQGTERSFHQIFIGGWGQSTVEFLDLEELASKLHAANRSTFFLTMQPLNVEAGIASPPNAMAIL